MYATRDDLEKAYGAQMIERLAVRPDDEDGAEAIARALDYAHGLIDARLSVRFVLPIPQVVPILTDLAVDLAVGRLASSNDAVTMTDELKHREKTARADLDRIADGKMNLGLPSRDQADRPQPIVASSGGKLFTREKLRGF